MPAISFEKIVPVERDLAVNRSMNHQTSGLAGQKLARKAPGTTLGRGRGIVINWLDRLVERRMEKVERDIARIRKKSAGSETR
jgi:hypothetical protein